MNTFMNEQISINEKGEILEDLKDGHLYQRNYYL